MAWQRIVLFGFMLLCLPGSALADCQELLSRTQALDDRIREEAARSNQYSAQIDQAMEEFRQLGQAFDACTEQEQCLGLLDRMDAAAVRVGELGAARQPLLENLVRYWTEMESLGRQGVRDGCFEQSKVNEVSEILAREKAVSQKNQELMGKSRTARQSVTQAREELLAQSGGVQGGGQASGEDEKEPPTIRIVNRAGMPICVHPSGMSGGSCFPAGEERVYQLDKLHGWDTDSGQKYKTNQIVIVGGGSWTGSPYTSYQGMTLCTQRTFSHESGEVVWRVYGGLEENCGVRGYHQ